MIKAILKNRRGKYITRVKMKDTKLMDSVVLIARICQMCSEKVPKVTPRMLLDEAMRVIEIDAAQARKQSYEKGEGLVIRCYKPEDECKHFDMEDGWCNRFNRPCAEVHDAGEREDE